ncbi:unnamed protein product, partial [Ectocarpus sp. 13 AM-2016]
ASSPLGTWLIVVIFEIGQALVIAIRLRCIAERGAGRGYVTSYGRTPHEDLASLAFVAYTSADKIPNDVKSTLTSRIHGTIHRHNYFRRAQHGCAAPPKSTTQTCHS